MARDRIVEPIKNNYERSREHSIAKEKSLEGDIDRKESDIEREMYKRE